MMIFSTRTIKEGVPATNNRKKDARLLYIMEFASSRFAALIELCTFMASKRDELFCGRRYAQAKIHLGMRFRGDFDRPKITYNHQEIS